MLRVSEQGCLSFVLHTRLYMGVCVLVRPHSAQSAKSRTSNPRRLPREGKRSRSARNREAVRFHRCEGNATRTSGAVGSIPTGRALTRSRA